MFKAKVITKLYPTEDQEKVSAALTAILEGEVKTYMIGNEKYLYIESTDSKDLGKFYELVRKQKILDATRKYLRNNIFGNSTVFFINKQVAFIGKINLCEEEGESPLGPIRIELESDNIEQLIDWLTPYTKNGVEVTLVSKFP
ncbi:MAG TPA: RNA-binding domain-containing protein [Candidatus Bathyarchaeia archaeon]|nr:RNA-binding domain-containing protein [Candidatus Bathyarchaeia archaeon]